MKLIPLIFLLIACTPDLDYSLDPSLAPYVESFYKEAEARGHYLRTKNMVVFKEDNLAKNFNVKAIYRKKKKQKSIAFDREYYEFIKKYPNRVEAIMFHELGHALLGREHTKACISLMNPTGCEVCYENDPARRKVLIDELFNPCDQ